MKKVKTPKVIPKAKQSRKSLPPISPAVLSPQTESLIATLSEGERQLLRDVLEVSAKTKMPPMTLLESCRTVGSLFPVDELMGLAKWSSQELEAFGWKQVQVWEGLFTLYRRGNVFVAELSDRLVDKEMKYRKANTQKIRNAAGIGIQELEKLQRALFCLHLRKLMGKSLGPIDAVILSDLTESVGAMMSEAWNYFPKKKQGAVSLGESSSVSGSSNRAVELTRFFSKAVSGLMNLKNHTKKATFSFSDIGKERAAIECARSLCGVLKRLPTKSEFRIAMEEKDYVYPNDRSRAAAKWDNMFLRCGLEALKD